MNQFVPADWTGNMGDALPPLRGEDDGLVELLWCSGHVVMQSQAPPRPAVRDLEPTPWFQYPIDESLEKDLFSEIFGAMPADGAGRPCTEEDKERGAADAVTALRSGVVPPPLLTDKAGLHGDNPRGSPASEAGESSVPTMGSRRVCGGSNQAQTAHVSYTAGNSVPLQLSGKEGRDAGSYHRASATLTSSLTWSRPSGASKRKQSEGAESPSEVTQDVESESADVTGGTAQKPTKAKRRRAAQVHNLSERRRRDRINEKMRALQELVPHCNKTDKASMLDEAIEYLKSLQLQVQAMWAMGGRMALAPAPVMFPAGAHQYMQRRLDVTSGMGRRMVGRLIDSLPQLGQPMHLPDRSCMFCRRVFVSSSCPQHFAHHGEQRDAAAALGLMVVRHLDGWPLVAAAQLPEGFGEGVQVRNIDGQVYHPIHRRPLHLEGVDRDAAARPCA